MSEPTFNVFPTEKAFSAKVLTPGVLFNKEDFTGIWSGQDRAITINTDVVASPVPKVVTTDKTIELECADDGSISGTVSYTVITGTGTDHTGANTVSDEERVIGFADFSTGNIALVEWGKPEEPLTTSETGTFNGFLDRNKNTLRVTQTQVYSETTAGGSKPLVSMMTLPKISNETP